MIWVFLISIFCYTVAAEINYGHPSKWEGMCRTGKRQSPIDLRWNPPQGGRFIRFNYSPTRVTAIDTGYTIQLNFRPGNSFEVSGHRFALRHLQFHAQSEHTISNYRYPLEIYLAHEDKNGKLAYISVLVAEGKHNRTLQHILDSFPRLGRRKRRVQVNLTYLLPRQKTHYHYEGSLTTPPCYEGVSWTVFNTPVFASRKQIQSFALYYSGNNRPIQKRHGRKLANY